MKLPFAAYTSPNLHFMESNAPTTTSTRSNLMWQRREVPFDDVWPKGKEL